MKIRRKMLVYFSGVTIMLLALTLLAIYFIFAEYREEDFQQRQKEKIQITLHFLTEFEEMNNQILDKIDLITLQDLYDEKLLIFDKNKKPIYASIDNTPIKYSDHILQKLSKKKPWFEGKEDLYDIVGVYVYKNGTEYYGIFKAYDTYGYSKLSFLSNLLLGTFLIISCIIIIVVFYLSKKISKPITEITNKITSFDINNSFHNIESIGNITEVEMLRDQFNVMMQRLNKSLSFQKSAIQHISHELKTPIAILVSNFDRIERETDGDKQKILLLEQKQNTKNLSEIIILLLEISKVESNQKLVKTNVSTDELVFDCVQELTILYPDFVFDIAFIDIEEEADLKLRANASLLKLLIMNMMLNAIQYSDTNSANIKLKKTVSFFEFIFENSGPTLSSSERDLMFHYYFRGKNSQNKKGFGLGLVFIYKICQIHQAKIEYSTPTKHTNLFKIQFPLS